VAPISRPEDLAAAIEDFTRRERRFGAVAVGRRRSIYCPIFRLPLSGRSPFPSWETGAKSTEES